MTAEAPLRMSRNGLVVDGEGWFVVNARESRWADSGEYGVYCTFEGKRRFPQFGINVTVLQPGQRMAMYHRERAQEAFLVLRGECILIVEDEEHVLREWDFFHCAPETSHVIVGAGGGPAVVLAVGARGRGLGEIVYPASKVSARHGASVQSETSDPREAYAGASPRRWTPYRDGSL